MHIELDARADPRRGLLLILVSALLWGTVGVATKAIYTLSDTNAPRSASSGWPSPRRFCWPPAGPCWAGACSGSPGAILPL